MGSKAGNLVASAGAVLALATSLPSLAADGAELATLQLSDLAAPEEELGDERKYWVLHKPGISLEAATADLTFCWRFVPHGVQRRTPTFVPWGQVDATRPVSYDGGQYGLVGAAIGAIIAGPLERSIRQTRLFRCMVPRGYARYRVTEEMWKRLYQAEPEVAIATLARIASGPSPPNGRVLP
jgi:hypothetical protein